MAQPVNIPITGDSKGLQKALKDGGQSAEQLNKKLGGSTQQSSKSFGGLTKAVQGFVGALAVKEIGQAVFELAKLGMSAERAEYALNALSGGRADEYIEAIQTAAQGTISELDAMSIANRALNMGVVKNSEDMATMVEMSAALGRVMGTTTTQAFNDMVTAGARQSKMIADNLGIMIDMNQLHTDANALYASGAVATMQEAESQAFLNQMLAQGADRFAQMGGLQDDNLSKAERADAAWQDLKQTLGEFVATPVANALEEIAGALKEVNEGLSHYKAGAEMTRNATQDFQDSLIQNSESFIEYSDAVIETWNNMRWFEIAMMGGRDALQLTEQEFYNAKAAAYEFNSTLDSTNRMLASAGLAAEEAAPQEEAVAESMMTAKEAAEQYRAALEDVYDNQTRLADHVADFDGQIGDLGATIITAAYSAEGHGDVIASLQQDVARTSGDLANARIEMEKWGGANAAANQQVADLEVMLLTYQQRLSDFTGEVKYGTSVVMELTDEQKAMVGTNFIDFMEGSGNAAMLAGGFYDEYRISMGLASEAQIALEHNLAALDEAMKAGNVTASQGADIYEQLVTGQLESADAAIEAAKKQQSANELLPDIYQQDQPAIVPEFDEESLSTAQGFFEEISTTASEANTSLEPLGANITVMAQGFASMIETVPQVFNGLLELVPLVAEIFTPLAQMVNIFRSDWESVLVTAPQALAGIEAAAGPLIGESGIGKLAALINGIRSDWEFLLAHPSADLTLNMTTNGGIAGGGSFYTQGPTPILVGDNPGGVERVDVTPISGRGETTLPNGVIRAAGGLGRGATGGGGGGSTQIVIPVILDGVEIARVTAPYIQDDFEARGLMESILVS